MAAAATTTFTSTAAAATTTVTRKVSIQTPSSLSFPQKPILTPRRLLAAPPASPIPYATVDNSFDNLDKPREECGVFGIIGDPSAFELTKLGLHSLQHRGQEGAGIVSSDGSSLHRAAGLGLVSEVFNSRSVNPLPGSAAIGHNRYATAGPSSSIANVQPFLASYRFGQLAVSHNGNLVNYRHLRTLLEDKGSIFSTSSDTEVVQHLIATSTTRPLLARIVEACEALEGSYSLLFLTSNKLIAVRDPYGFRPLVMGRRKSTGAIVFASETCALDLIKAEYIREVNPGEVVVIDGETMEETTLCIATKKPRKACIFEHVYFALPNSVVFGHPVNASRYAFGRALAQESAVPGADIVIPVPDSGFFAALGFSSLSGLPFRQGLIRSHYVARTFIQPTQEARDLAVRLKLSPVREILEGKSVVVIDDSIVRGTTSSQIIQLIRNEGGAKEVHMRIASPPIVGSCYYGVDTPRSEELISNRMDVEGVRREIGSDSLAFLSLDSLKEPFGDEGNMFCDACFTRDYPVPPN